MRFDEPLELEHHPGAALRIGRGPGGLRGFRGVDGFLEIRGSAEAHMGLNLALVGIEYVALALAGREGRPADEMVNGTEHVTLSSLGIAELHVP